MCLRCWHCYRTMFLGATREGAALDVYLAAFARMTQEGNNHLIVGERAGQIVATYQLTLISGLSLGGCAPRAAGISTCV